MRLYLFVFYGFCFLLLAQEAQTTAKKDILLNEEVELVGLDDLYKEKKGIFIQASLGGSLHYGNFDGSYNQESKKYHFTTLNSLIAFGLGYQFFFNTFHGLRGTTTTLYRDFKHKQYKNAAPLNVITTEMALDYLWDFSDSKSPFGCFIGVGYGWNYGRFLRDLKASPYIEDSKVFKTHGFFVHIGLSKTFSFKHRIEFEYVLPFYRFLDFSGSGINHQGIGYEIHQAQYYTLMLFKLNYIYKFGGINAY